MLLYYGFFNFKMSWVSGAESYQKGIDVSKKLL